MEKRVLVVEDDEAIAQSVAEIVRLEAPRFETVLAKNGREAERIMHEDPLPCLVFLDLHMPEMGGDEFLVRKKTDVRAQKVPVVVMTATGEDRTGENHVSRTIHKPFDLVAILEELDAHC